MTTNLISLPNDLWPSLLAYGEVPNQWPLVCKRFSALAETCLFRPLWENCRNNSLLAKEVYLIEDRQANETCGQKVKQLYQRLMKSFNSLEKKIPLPKELIFASLVKHLEELARATNLLKMFKQIKIPQCASELAVIASDIASDHPLIQAQKVRQWLETHPTEVGKMIYFHLDNLDLTEVPKEIGKFTKLCGLQLQCNQFEELPQEISKFTSLTYLDVGTNPRLKTLPAEIRQLPKLRYLFTDDRFLACSPEE